MFSLSLVVTADGCRSGGATCCVIRMIICVNLTAFNERSQHMCANQSERLIFYISLPTFRHAIVALVSLFFIGSAYLSSFSIKENAREVRLIEFRSIPLY
jgi:hypothetical protein